MKTVTMISPFRDTAVVMIAYGHLVHNRRKEMGLTQSLVAIQLEVTQNVLSRIENGIAREIPTPEFMSAIERVLNIPVMEQLETLGYFQPGRYHYEVSAFVQNPFPVGSHRWKLVERLRQENIPHPILKGIDNLLDVAKEVN